MPERSDVQRPVSPTNRPTAPEPQQPVETASQVPYVQDQNNSLPPVFGRYRILQLLGKGGMGAVYAAQDTKLERKVALKVPLIPQGNPVLRERFLREARAMAAFDHPHICKVYDVDELNGVLFYTMRFIEGQPLSSWIKPDKPLSQKQAAMLVHKCALALEFAHDQGIIHRDLKPANIMIRKSAEKGTHEPIIMDFGLARRDQTDDLRLTRSGAPMGTIPYMSPEQLKGETKLIGPGCDIYSLGAVLYELLTGQMQLVRNSLVELQVAILKEEPPEPRTLRADLDPRLAAICLKCLRQDKDERYRTMKELAGALQKVVSKPAVCEATANPASKTDTDIFSDYPEVVAARTAPPPARQAPMLQGSDYAAETKKERHTWLALGGAAVATEVIALIVLLIASNLGTGKGNGTQPTYDASSTRPTGDAPPPPPQIPRNADRERGTPSPPPSNGNSAFQIGDYVTNKGLFQNWIGRVINVGDTHRIRITYANDNSGYTVNQEVSFKPDEFKALTDVSLDAALKGYK
jgi:serine/threonine protein kinase